MLLFSSGTGLVKLRYTVKSIGCLIFSLKPNISDMGAAFPLIFMRAQVVTFGRTLISSRSVTSMCSIFPVMCYSWWMQSWMPSRTRPNPLIFCSRGAPRPRGDIALVGVSSSFPMLKLTSKVFLQMVGVCSSTLFVLRIFLTTTTCESMEVSDITCSRSSPALIVFGLGIECLTIEFYRSGGKIICWALAVRIICSFRVIQGSIFSNCVRFFTRSSLIRLIMIDFS